jgi:transposase
MRQRRLRAAELFGHGATQAEVARTLRVSRQAVSVWHARLQAGGTTALAGAGRQGRRPQLSAEQRAVIDQALRQGARAHGFASDGWTLTRVAQVIWRLTGVRHHPGHVWRVLRQLRWSLQCPARRALERDEAAIRRWVATDWPRIRQNARRRRAQIVFWDESGVSLLPVVRRTWAPVGSTPVLDHHFNWQRVSIAAALCYGSRGGGARLAYQLRDRAYDTAALIDTLMRLRRFLAGEKATVLWDGLPAHRSRDMQRFLASQRRWLVVERLPGYAPELNPVEGLWDARIDVKWRGALGSRPGWRGRPRGPGSASSTA